MMLNLVPKQPTRLRLVNACFCTVLTGQHYVSTVCIAQDDSLEAMARVAADLVYKDEPFPRNVRVEIPRAMPGKLQVDIMAWVPAKINEDGILEIGHFVLEGSRVE
jgi:hypothetical protein